MKHFIILVITTLFFTSCGNDERPKVIYPENEDSDTLELRKDSTLIEIADIPIHIDSTNYLIHPIGDYKMFGSRGKIYSGSSGFGSGSFSISNYNRYKITGNLHNLKFQMINSENLSTLTTKNIRIKSVSFLRGIFDNTKKQILVYTIIDRDSNRDNKLDDDDIETLYISNIDGTNFTKLTAEFQELIDWKVLEIKNRLYFRSIEDTNKNGEFDKEDDLHYQYIDFSNNKLKVTEYKPI
jgi:PBP1b-binding outer membrane lipoprotein LpoB